LRPGRPGPGAPRGSAPAPRDFLSGSGTTTVFVAPTERRRQDHPITVAQVQGRGGLWLVRLASGRGQQCRREPQQFRADSAFGSAVYPNMDTRKIFEQQRHRSGIANPPPVGHAGQDRSTTGRRRRSGWSGRSRTGSRRRTGTCPPTWANTWRALRRWHPARSGQAPLF
jgi:hypothetical protein